MFKKTYKVLVFNILSIFISTIVSFLTTYIVVNTYGSETNGIFQTANHFINMFTFVEGGFVVSAVVKLYAAMKDNNTMRINSIISLIKYFLQRVALCFTVISIMATFIYVPHIKTSLNRIDIYFIFIISILNMGLTLYQSYNNAIFEANQEEYYLKIALSIANFFQIVGIILVASIKSSVIWIRLCVLISTLIYVVLINAFRKKKYPFIKFVSEKKDRAIFLKESMDVMIQKIASIINQSLDIFLLSIFGYVVYASVYGVYNLIFNFAKVLGDNIVAAPINGIGRLLNTGNKKELNKVIEMYEFLCAYVYIFLLSLCSVLAIPFISCYVKTPDVDIYMNSKTILLFAFVIFFNTLNRTSGYVINYSGNFKFQRNVLCLSTFVNLFISIFAVQSYGINGILFATLISYIFLVPFNIYKAYSSILDNFGWNTIKNYVSYFLIFSCVNVFAMFVSRNILIENYFQLLILAIVAAAIILILLYLSALIFFRKELKYSLSYLRGKIYENKK